MVNTGITSRKAKPPTPLQMSLPHCFAITSLKASELPAWTAAEVGHNSPLNIRPLALFPTKETDGLLREFIPTLDEEVKQLKMAPANMTISNGKEITQHLTRSYHQCTMGR